MYLVPFLLAVLAGFALLEVPLEETFLAGLAPLVEFIAVIVILVFSIVIIVKAVLLLWKNT